MRSPVHDPVFSWKSVPPLDCILIIIFSPGESSGGHSLPHFISTALLHSPSLLPHKASMGEPPPETRVCTASFSRLLRHSQVAEEVAVVGIPALAVGHGGWQVVGVLSVLGLTEAEGPWGFLLCYSWSWGQMFFLRKLSLPRLAGPLSSGKGLLFVSRIMVFLFF